MGKTKAKWLNRDVADPDHVGAETLPFDAVSTIKEKTLQIYSGAQRIPTTEPVDADMLARETVMWLDGNVLRRKYKDADGAVRYTEGATGITVVVKNSNHIAVDGEFVVCTAPVYVTLKTAPNAQVTVKNGNESDPVVVLTESGTIDGAANYSVSTQYASVKFVCDGTNWWIA